MKLFLILTFLTVLQSCKFQLNEKDLEWNPYKKGDKLTFISDENIVDTITITEIVNYTQAKNSIQKVMCEYSPDKRSNKQKISTFFLALTAWKDYCAISLNFPMGDGKLIPYISKRTSEIDSLPKSLFDFKNKSFNDVISLTPNHSSNTNNNYSNTTFATTIFWSKSIGLISYYTNNNNTHWKLKDKYRL